MGRGEETENLFVQEAIELIDDLERALSKLESRSDDRAQLEEVFRVMHSFKGTARMFGFARIGEFAHYLESVFDGLRRGVIQMSDAIFRVAFDSVVHLRHLLYAGDQYDESLHRRQMAAVKRMVEQTISLPVRVSDERLYLVTFKPSVDFFRAGHNPLTFIYELSSFGNILVRTHTDRLPSISEFSLDSTYLYWSILIYTAAGSQSIQNEFLEVEDLCDIIVTELAKENWLERPGFSDFLNSIHGDITIELLQAFVDGPASGADDETQADDWASRFISRTTSVDCSRVNRITRLVAELASAQSRLGELSTMADNPALREALAVAGELVNELRSETMGLSLFPASHLFGRFERVINDTSRELGKRVRLVTHGGDIEVDGDVLKRMADPAMHILRNCIDHGIESPDVRRRMGKDETGTVKVTVARSGDVVSFEITDDGGGIDVALLGRKALEEGIISDHCELSQRELLNLVFHPGLTTAEQVTSVSGRGVGMDIVKHAVAKLGGEIEVDSVKGIGTKFRIAVRDRQR